MTEALQKDYEKTCAERIDEQWKLRQEDLQDPERTYSWARPLITI